MTTFSQLVDKMVAETRRPDLQTEVGSYVNLTLRELHMEPKNGNAVFFKENLKEDQLTANIDSGFYWDVPKPSTFQGMAAVRYDSVFDSNRPVYPKEMNPGRIMNEERHFFYRSGSRIWFRGYGGNGALISMAWFEYVPYLQYYASGSRPAIYDDFSGWTYASGITTDDQKAVAQSQVTNWLLLRHATIIEEGMRAKIYKRLGDDIRARTSYSMYSTLRQGMYGAEVADLGIY